MNVYCWKMFVIPNTVLNYFCVHLFQLFMMLSSLNSVIHNT